ncbi:hypothetical protein NP590_16185 [Methylomonas sp. SURF-2]|uniref:GTPase n=1 Tax=Methylomonas subterranea TaxID=2952225 RepID=A0ABT1TJJ4_9GAMM|nr:hypothetical protein [Methylomonas sp. SURF-2]MCQ8105652.1 hypothetical protein [Methylomonas sp. SURF-2]
MTTDDSLPFELQTDSLAQWLDGLSPLPHAQAAHKLNLALKQLKEPQCTPGQLLPLLVNLTPLCLRFSASLSTTAINDADSSAKILKLGKLSMQLPRQLALLFCQIIESKQLEAADRNTAVYHALQLIGHALRCYCLFYETPSVTLWKKTAQLYKLALATEALHLPHATKLADFRAQPDIETVLKRNLLFSIMSPLLYKPDEINQLFQLADQCATLLEIGDPRESRDFGFYWNTLKDQPPYPVRKSNRPLPAECMPIDCRPISHALQLGTVVTKLSPANQNKLALLFSDYQQVFNAIIPGIPSRTKMIPGFIGVCQYLQELNKLSKINQISAQLRDPKSINRGLSLVPLEHHRNVFDNAEQPFGDKTSLGRLVNLLKTPNKTYCVAESRMLDCSTGDLVLLYKEQHPVSLAIIRQQRFNELSNANQFLLEQISGACTIYSINNAPSGSYALMVGEGMDNAQIFLASGKYSLNSSIPLTIGTALRLTACMESNGFFARFRFSVEYHA